MAAAVLLVHSKEPLKGEASRGLPRGRQGGDQGLSLIHIYIYGCDSIMLDLEDAVAENQKDAARFSLYHALKTIDYGDTEVIVRINGLDTPHWQEDIREMCIRDRGSTADPAGL